MNEDDTRSRLSRISTRWTLLKQAHGFHADDEVRAARNTMMHRYLGAVYRYLLAAVRDADLAEELMQEFAVRFLAGRFRGARPDRGRFRDYIKTCLFHLVSDHFRSKRKLPTRGLAGEPADPAQFDPAEHEAMFHKSWRNELLAQAWAALKKAEEDSGQPFHTVMTLRVSHTDVPSAELAQLVSGHTGRPCTADNFRQILRRGRERFAAALFAEITRSLRTASREQIAAELADLNLLQYCRHLLNRHAGAAGDRLPPDSSRSPADPVDL